MNSSTKCKNKFIEPWDQSKIYTRAGPTKLSVKYFIVITSRSFLGSATNYISAQYSATCSSRSESPRNLDENWGGLLRGVILLLLCGRQTGRGCRRSWHVV